jgi:branched-chain amino acid transport system substrate-binding protein
MATWNALGWCARGVKAMARAGALAAWWTLCTSAAGQTPAPGTSPAPTPANGNLVLGMSTALTGPAAGLGLDMRAGVEAALAEANRNGGIKGHPVKLVVLDDGYEPSRTAPNMKQLIQTEHVLGVIGNVGTPTAVVAIPIAQQSGTAFFGAFTGAGVLRRSPPDKVVINYRASYAEETAAMVGALIDQAGLQADEIGFFTQRDAYGDAGFNGGVTALKAHGLKNEANVPHGRYDRNTLAVDEGVAELLGSPKPLKAIIMVGTAQPSAKFVKRARESGITARMLSVSFVGATQLAALLGKDADGVIVARVVPHQNADLPIVREFRAAMADESLREHENALEGYIVGRIMCRALSTIPGDATRESLIAALEGLGEFDLGLGAPLKLSPAEHQACRRVWATRLRDSRVEPIEWTDLRPGAPAAASAETAP